MNNFNEFLIVLVTFYAVTILPQNNYKITNLVHVSTVRKVVCQDDTVWACTDQGLFKLNQKNDKFEFFNKTNSPLTDKDIYCLALDKTGTKWIGTGSFGVIKYDGKNWTDLLNSTPALSNNYIRALEIDKQNRIWIGAYHGGLSVFNGSNWSNYDYKNSTLNRIITGIAFEDEKNTWFSSHDGIVKFDNNTFTVYDVSNSGLPQDWVNAIQIDSLGNKWIGMSYSGIAKFDNNNWQVFNSFNSGLEDNHINTMAINTDGKLWIGTATGVTVYDGINWKVYNEKNTKLPDYSISSIAFDKYGNKWFGTNSCYLYKFDGVNWKIYFASNSAIPSNNITCFNFDSSPIKLIGTDKGLLREFINEKKIYNSSNTKLTSGKIRALINDQEGYTWVSNEKGNLAKFTDTNWTYYSMNYDEFVNAFDFDKDGTLWIVRNNSQLWSYANNSLSFVRWVEGLVIDNLFIIDKNNRKWFGTNKGLLKHEGSDITIYNSSNSGFPNTAIISIDIDINQNIWLGTINGLVKFDGVNWTIFSTTNSGLPINSIYAIAADPDGNIWIGGNNNLLTKFDGSNWTSFKLIMADYDKISQIKFDPEGNGWVGTTNSGIFLIQKEIPNSVKNDYNKEFSYILNQNYPNPFNPTTSINYSVAKAGQVKLVIYDLLGREIKTLVDEVKNPGNYTVNFNASPLSSGVYFYTLQAGGFRETKKMILLR